MPGALERGLNGIRATVGSPRERSRRFVRVYLVLFVVQTCSSRFIRPRVFPDSFVVGIIHVEEALLIKRPAKQIRRTARGRGRGRFSVFRNLSVYCLTNRAGVCVCVSCVSSKTR